VAESAFVVAVAVLRKSSSLFVQRTSFALKRRTSQAHDPETRDENRNTAAQKNAHGGPELAAMHFPAVFDPFAREQRARRTLCRE